MIALNMLLLYTEFCHPARQFTKLFFILRCLVCDALLKGLSEAQDHATKTSDICIIASFFIDQLLSNRVTVYDLLIIRSVVSTVT